MWQHTSRRVLICVGTLALSFGTVAWGQPPQFTAQRLGTNPIISSQMFVAAGVADDGRNINGPSLIRVPDWLTAHQRADPSANYYLYFADHQGQHIRMAWAAQVQGPYHLYQPGAGVLSLQDDRAIKRPVGDGNLLMLSDALAIGGHIASPDVHVDNVNRRIVMLFHGFEESVGDQGKYDFKGPDGQIWSRKEPQMSFAATSPTGLDFHDDLKPRTLGDSYLRAFQVGGKWYASGRNRFWGATDPADITSPYTVNEGSMSLSARHTAVRVDEDGTVTLFYSRIGGEPEHIVYINIQHIEQRTSKRIISDPVDLLTPEFDWEGANLPIFESEPGDVNAPVHQLRDPAFFRDIDGKEYLLYSVAGEQGVAIARLHTVPEPTSLVWLGGGLTMIAWRRSRRDSLRAAFGASPTR